MTFQMQSNGVNVGPYTTGYAQECIVNKVLFGLPKSADPGWSPPYNASSAAFYAANGQIIDIKTVPNSATYSTSLAYWTTGTAFFTRTQQLQTTYVDPCGNYQVYSLGSVNFASVKKDATTWYLIQQ